MERVKSTTPGADEIIIPSAGKPQDSRREPPTLLTYSQVNRLHSMFGDLIIKPNHRYQRFPTINVQMQALVRSVQGKLDGLGVPVRDVRLNGGAASHVLGNDEEPVYNDFDLIFGVDLGGKAGGDDAGAERVKQAVLRALQDFIPGNEEGCGVKDKPSLGAIEEVYVHKMVRVTNEDNRWSLISLATASGYDVELKFVDRMKRQFEFSVDSFQIVLDNLLTFYANSQLMTPKFFPRVEAESVYGRFETALAHLNGKLIATDSPEQIRGGGLFKYCHLIARGYKPVNDDVHMMEKYMCSRFFIDFPGIAQQHAKLEAYLANHFGANRGAGAEYGCAVTAEKFAFLRTLHSVVEESTVCLMGQERMQTLSLIHTFAQRTITAAGFILPYAGSTAPAQQNWRRPYRGGRRYNHPMYFGGSRHIPTVYMPYQYLAQAESGHFVSQGVPFCMPSYYVLS